MIDFELTDEQRLIQETARDFADNEIAPRARENDRTSRFDTEIVAKMAEMGFIGPILPEEYGGRGIDYRTYGLIVEEIGRADSSARTVVSVNTSLVGSVIAKFGHRGAEEGAASPASARARRSAASASPSPTPAPTPPTSRRARRRSTAAGRSAARSSGSRWATWRSSR